MASVTYTPKFQSPEYVDNVDRVQAGGPKGFNFQFQQLQAEFIHQRSCLQITPTSLSPHKGGSDLAQMRVDQGDQFLERAWFPRLPPGQQQGDFARKRFQASLQLSILSGTSLASRRNRRSALKTVF